MVTSAQFVPWQLVDSISWNRSATSTMIAFTWQSTTTASDATYINEDETLSYPVDISLFAVYKASMDGIVTGEFWEEVLLTNLANLDLEGIPEYIQSHDYYRHSYTGGGGSPQFNEPHKTCILVNYTNK